MEAIKEELLAELFVKALKKALNGVENNGGEEKKLGFMSSPKKIYVHVKQSEDCLWHYFDENDIKIPIQQNCLYGRITNFEVKETPENRYVEKKVHVTVQADRTYVIATGDQTVFARQLSLAIASASRNQLMEPVKICLESGDKTKQTVFANLYDSNDNQIDSGWVKAKEECRDPKKWDAVHQTAVRKIKELTNVESVLPKTEEDTMGVIEEIRLYTNYSKEAIRNWIANECGGVPSSKELFGLISSMCVHDRTDSFENKYMAQNSYNDFVKNKLEKGLSIKQAAIAWLEENPVNNSVKASA